MTHDTPTTRVEVDLPDPILAVLSELLEVIPEGETPARLGRALGIYIESLAVDLARARVPTPIDAEMVASALTGTDLPAVDAVQSLGPFIASVYAAEADAGAWEDDVWRGIVCLVVGNVAKAFRLGLGDPCLVPDWLRPALGGAGGTMRTIGQDGT